MDQADTLPMGDIFSDPVEEECTDELAEGGEEEAEREEDEEIDVVESHDVYEGDQVNDFHDAPCAHGKSSTDSKPAVPEKLETKKTVALPAQPDEHPKIESDAADKVEERAKGTNKDCRNHA